MRYVSPAEQEARRLKRNARQVEYMRRRREAMTPEELQEYYRKNR